VRTLAEKYTQPTVTELLIVAAGLCKGLAYLHTRRVVLCNVALRTALLSANNVAKVGFSLCVCVNKADVDFFHFFPVEPFSEHSSVPRRDVL
jgi:hypothetical protein